MMATLQARLAVLEEKAAALHPTSGLIMPDGSVVAVGRYAVVECLGALIDAAGEGRMPEHPTLAAVLEAVGEDGGGSMCELVQELYRGFMEDFYFDGGPDADAAA